MTRQEFLLLPLNKKITLSTLITDVLNQLEIEGMREVPNERTLLRRYKSLINRINNRFEYLKTDKKISSGRVYIEHYFEYYLIKYLLTELALKNSPTYVWYKGQELSTKEKFYFVERAEQFFNKEGAGGETDDGQIISYMVTEMDYIIGKLSAHMREVCFNYVCRIQKAYNHLAANNTENDFEAYRETVVSMVKLSNELKRMCREIEDNAYTSSNSSKIENNHSVF